MTPADLSEFLLEFAQQKETIKLKMQNEINQQMETMYQIMVDKFKSMHETIVEQRAVIGELREEVHVKTHQQQQSKQQQQPASLQTGSIQLIQSQPSSSSSSSSSINHPQTQLLLLTSPPTKPSNGNSSFTATPTTTTTSTTANATTPTLILHSGQSASLVPPPNVSNQQISILSCKTQISKKIETKPVNVTNRRQTRQSTRIAAAASSSFSANSKSSLLSSSYSADTLTANNEDNDNDNDNDDDDDHDDVSANLLEPKCEIMSDDEQADSNINGSVVTIKTEQISGDERDQFSVKLISNFEISKDHEMDIEQEKEEEEEEDAADCDCADCRNSLDNNNENGGIRELSSTSTSTSASSCKKKKKKRKLSDIYPQSQLTTISINNHTTPAPPPVQCNSSSSVSATSSPFESMVPVLLKEQRIKTLQIECLISGCGQMFESKHLQQFHMRQQHGVFPYRCLIAKCGLSFINSLDFGGHMRTVHPVSLMTQWPCSSCPKSFKSYERLSNHVTHYHARGVYQCNVNQCTFTAAFRHQIYDHDLATHKSYICCVPDCAKMFKRKEHLQRHERLHFGCKPYRCKWPRCTYSSENQHPVLNHIRDVHFLLPKIRDPPGTFETRDPREYLEVRRGLLNHAVSVAR